MNEFYFMMQCSGLMVNGISSLATDHGPYIWKNVMPPQQLKLLFHLKVQNMSVNTKQNATALLLKFSCFTQLLKHYYYSAWSVNRCSLSQNRRKLDRGYVCQHVHFNEIFNILHPLHRQIEWTRQLELINLLIKQTIIDTEVYKHKQWQCAGAKKKRRAMFVRVKTLHEQHSPNYVFTPLG